MVAREENPLMKDDDDLVEDDVDLDEDEDEDDEPDVAVDAELEEDEEGDDAAGDDDEGDSASLDELLAQRAAARPGAEESDEEPDIMSIRGEEEDPAVAEPPPSRVAPMKDQEEFRCNSCFLVKPRVQLADAKRGFCRDCV